MGYWPSVARPQNWNEKLQWRKIFDHNPVFGDLTDKLKTKIKFKEAVKVVEPTWIGMKFSDIPEEKLNTDCVVKSNCACGQNIFIRDGNYDKEESSKKTSDWMKKRYGFRKGEWAYAQIQRRLFVEPMLMSESGEELVMINVETFFGDVDNVFVVTGKQYDQRRAAIFDKNGKRIDVTTEQHLKREAQFPNDYLPLNFFEAVAAARKLGEEIDYARIDFMSVNGELYGSEFTLYSLSGYVRYTDPEISNRMGADGA